MIHPHTVLRHVNDAIGDGIFASADIPKGTLVYVKDPLEIDLSREEFEALDGPVRELADKYSYIEERGHRILSWDTAKYVNHSCQPNTISAGYGFEIAIRDIRKGEEVTDEYGLFNLESTIVCHCGSPSCRGMISGSDIDHYHVLWDQWVISALRAIPSVEQPLWTYLDRGTRRSLNQFLSKGSGYRSVLELKYRPRPRAAVGSGSV